MSWGVLLVVAALAAADVEDTPELRGETPLPETALDDALEPGRWSFAVVPRLTLSSDDGLGVGARGTAFWHRFGTSPYKTAVSAQLWATTNLVQHHYLKVDAIDAFNLPVRIEAEAGLFSTLSFNYCVERACVDDTRTKLRYTSPYLRAQARAKLRPRDALGPKVELVGGMRSSYLWPGTLLEAGPYPRSDYARRFPLGEQGVMSWAVAGVVVDTRDFEPDPTRGVLWSLLLRGAGPATGSAWSATGVSTSLAVFSPLARPLFGDRVVLASRVVVDDVIGDLPVVELGKVGGLDEVFAFGGQDAGRGIRQQRLLGAAKLFAQHEVRIDAAHFDVFDGDLGLGAAAFFDVGAAGDSSLTSLDAAFGGGVGARVSWGRTFVMRLDVALSPLEGWRAGVYTAPGQEF